MLDLNNLESQISTFKNPFLKEKIRAVNINMIVAFNEVHWSGNIQLNNGQTFGQQSFEGKDFADIVRQMEAFIKALE